jgi:Flp pilus assembly pilin Flp
MTRLLAAVKRLVNSEDGQDLIEYGLTAALIAIVCVAALTSAGGKVDSLWTSIIASV